MADTAEDFTIRLHEMISPAARVAENALAQLEARIQRQKDVIGGLEAKLSSAAEKLRDMARGGADNTVNIAAFKKQQQVVAGLQQKLVDAKASMDALTGARPAAGIVSSMQQARAEIEKAAAALEELNAQQQLMGKGASKSQADGMTAAIAKQRGAVQQAQHAYMRMGGTAKDALAAGGNQAQSANLKVNELAEGFGRLGGPVGNAGSRIFGLADGLGKLKGSLGGTGMAAAGAAAAIAIVVVAVVALTAAVIAGIVHIAQWGVKLADAARSAGLTVAAIEQTHASLANLGKIMPSITRATGLSGESLTGLAKQLADAKVKAADMPAALRAVAMAEAALGQGGAAKFIQQLKDGKTNATKLAAEMESKFGGIVRAKMLSLDSQTARFKRLLGETFGGLKIDGLLKALKKLIDMFDTANGSGQTLKMLFEGFFQPIIDWAAKALVVAEAFFLGMQIGVLELILAFAPLIKWLKKVLGFNDSNLEETLNSAVTAGKVFVVVMVAGLVSVLVMLGLVAAAVAVMAAPFIIAAGVIAASIALAIGAVLLAVGIMVGAVAVVAALFLAPFIAIAAAIRFVVKYLTGIDLADIGLNMIKGLANGIIKGGTAVYEAIAGVVKGAITGAKTILEEKSPSRVFFRSGVNVSEGMALGVEARTARVHDAITTMVLPTEVANDVTPFGSGGGGGSAGGSDGGRRIEFNNCTFGGDLTPSSLREMLVPIFDEMALAEGS